MTQLHVVCHDCRHSFLMKDAVNKPIAECRRYPPQCGLIPSPPRIAGGPMGYTKQSFWPIVLADHFCGEASLAFDPERWMDD